MTEPAALPKSVARWIDPLLSAAVIIALYCVFRLSSVSGAMLVVIVTAGVAVMQSLPELYCAPWRGTRRPDVPLKNTLREAGIKWLGVVLGAGLMLAGWWCLPEYHLPHYRSLFKVMPVVLPVMLAACAVCIFVTEWRLGPGEDYNRHFGLFMLGRWDEVDWELIRVGLVAWLIRGVFLAANFCGLVFFVNSFRGKELELLQGSWVQTEFFLDRLSFGVLLASIIPGYLFASRLLGTSIRKVEQSWFGWAVTLICYSPFFKGTGLIVGFTHDVHPGWMMPWAVLTQDKLVLSYIIGTALLVCSFMHYWGEAAIGIRSSNLSNRGIITNGPYRFTKHPVYFFKCVAWGLLWLPWMSFSEPTECLRFTILWMMHNGIFFMRSWVEERLLRTDPDYVAYALWIDEHGMFAGLGKRIPVLSYRWRLEHWKKQESKS